MLAGIVHRLLVVLSAAVLAVVAAAACAPGAGALSAPTPWDGTNPFNCTVQDAGLGTTVPDPGADPYCVHFDKTQQNVSQLGVVDFLLKEPARVAAAVPKCFYYQEDHWRGSLIQSDQRTVLYEFTGHYFFNKATGDGGAWVTGFSIAGQTFDPTSLPGFPPGYGQYFGPGTGGVITHDDIPADPRCAAEAAADPAAIYASRAAVPRCVARGGSVGQAGIGPVTFGLTEDRLRARIGPPATVKRGWLGYCVTGGGQLLVGEPGDRTGTLGSGGSAPAVIALTTSPAFTLAGRGGRLLSPGVPARRVRGAFPRARGLAEIRGLRVLRLGRGLVAATGRGRVRWLAAYDPGAVRTRAALVSFLRRAG